MSHSYTCASCHGTFEAERSDEDAVREAEQLFGERPDTHDMAVVCDDCFQQMQKWFGWPIPKGRDE